MIDEYTFSIHLSISIRANRMKIYCKALHAKYNIQLHFTHLLAMQIYNNGERTEQQKKIMTIEGTKNHTLLYFEKEKHAY